MLFVCYPKCSTCGKARAWLDAHIETLYQYCSDSKNVNLLAR